MNYSDYINQVGATFQIPVQDATSATPFGVAAYNTALPRSIDYIENRIQRDLDFINTQIASLGTLTIGQRNFDLPTISAFVVVEGVYIVGRPPMLPMSIDALQAFYPGDGPGGTPQYWAPVNGISIAMGPPPDSAYSIIVFGTARVPQLSNSNATNLVSTLYPDIYVAAGNIFWATFQRDFMQSQGAQQQGLMGFEQIYRGLMQPALIESYRQKFQANGWTSRLPSSIATPPQT